MRLFIFVLSFLLGSCVYGQTNPALNYFTANLINDEVYLSMEIKGGNTCNGIKIYRSVDSISFTEIGTIPGICGDANFAQQYDFTDKAPVANAINYYKVELGGLGFSETKAVEYISLDDKRYKIYPHPVTSGSVLFFKNDDNEDFKFELYDRNGALIDSRRVEGQDRISMDMELKTGVYIFKLINLDKVNTDPIVDQFIIN